MDPETMANLMLAPAAGSGPVQFLPGNYPGPFGLYGLNLAPPAPTAPAWKYDLDFMDGVNARVRVQVDRNARGLVTSAHAGAARDFADVPGFTDVPVILAPGKATVEHIDERPTQVLAWEVLFGQPVAFGVNHRLVLDDPDRPDRPRYLTFDGPTIDDFLMRHHWYAALREVVRPDE